MYFLVISPTYWHKSIWCTIDRNIMFYIFTFYHILLKSLCVVFVCIFIPAHLPFFYIMFFTPCKTPLMSVALTACSFLSAMLISKFYCVLKPLSAAFSHNDCLNTDWISLVDWKGSAHGKIRWAPFKMSRWMKYHFIDIFKRILCKSL